MSNQLSDWLFNPSGLTPHGFCLLWEPGLIWTYALSDIGIAIAYFTIPLALIVVIRRRPDLVFRPVFGLFAAFILLCGTTHVLDVLTLWVPAYGVEALVKVATATVSIVTAVMLWRLLPQALTLPSVVQLNEANAMLLEREAQLHQAQKMQAVGQLTGGIAHDFNNLLQSISGGLDMMERRIGQGAFDAVPRYLPAMRQALDRAATLTHRLVAFSSQQPLQPRSVEPDRLVRGMEELIRRTLGPTVTLELHLHDGVWNALCDPNQLESALLNLVINARDAMPDGGTVTVATADRHLGPAEIAEDEPAPPGDYVEIRVTDTGSGMTPEVLSRAFEPFFTTKAYGQGTGLGLPQIYGFARQSGGMVRLASRPGQGTTASLFMPRHDGAGTVAEPPPDSQEAGIADLQVAAKTVLVVDDEAAIRALVAEALLDLNCTVVEAQDAQAALDLLASGQRIDLLVTDIGLPGMNGRLLAEAARGRYRDLPVLLITGYAGDAIDDKPLAPGMALMRKPFVLAGLAAQVHAMLENRAGPREAV